MNILAIDYGVKNIGLAWCQIGLDVVLPYGKLKTSDWETKLVNLIKEEGINKIVVGLPLGQGGKENDNTKRTRDFVDELKTKIDPPVEFVDERYSSKQADKMEDPISSKESSRYSTHAGLRQVKTANRSSRDERAAMVILESYISR